MKHIIVLLSIVALIGSSCTTKSPQKYPPVDLPVPEIDLFSTYEEQRKRPYQDRNLALAVAISGGGHRAANFGVGVLVALEAANVLYEVDYLSTVSGGGFAAAAYIETLIYHLNHGGTHRDYSLKTWLEEPQKVGIIDSDDYLTRHLERGYETSLYWGFLNPKTWFSNIDRGDFLEKKIDSRILGYNKRGRSLLLNDVFRDSQKAECDGEVCNKMVPNWVANATIFQNGAIFQFIPNILE
jgi:hypothetical protein